MPLPVVFFFPVRVEFHRNLIVETVHRNTLNEMPNSDGATVDVFVSLYLNVENTMTNHILINS